MTEFEKKNQAWQEAFSKAKVQLIDEDPFASEQFIRNKAYSMADEAVKKWPPNDTALMTSADWVH